MTEYDPIPPREPLSDGPSDLDRVSIRFENASVGYLRSPWSWWAWSVLLPLAALLAREVSAFAGYRAVLMVWSVFILAGGLVEGMLILAGGATHTRTPLAGWVLRTQGNLSLVALAMTAVLLWQDLASFVLPLWLLLVGHSFYSIGKLSFAPMRTAGLIMQAGGVIGIIPGVDSYVAFALSAFAACLWIGVGVFRRRRRLAPGDVRST